MKTQPNPGQRDRYRQGEGEDHAHRSPLAQQKPTLRESMPDHGGHIPS